jgi:hypothetical protein
MKLPYHLHSLFRVLNRNRKLNLYEPGLSREIKGHALLAYIVYPFYMDENDSRIRSHINVRNARTIVGVLNYLGYVVDVIDYQDTKFKPEKKYDIAIGIGQSLGNLKEHLPDTTMVYYATGLHNITAANLTYNRHLAFQRRHNVFIPLARVAPVSYSPEISGCIISCQNKFTDDTYTHLGIPIFDCTMSGTIPDYPILPKTKNTHTILWISGAAMILKGLDLVLDALFEVPWTNLIICADLKAEDKQFLETYSDFLTCKNIRIEGYVDVGSERFKKIAEECTAVIFPYPEGEISGSLINAMYHGIIPILSYFSNPEMEACSFKTGPDVASVTLSLLNLITATDEEIHEKSKLTLEYARKHFSQHAEYLDWLNAIRKAEQL